MPCWRANAGHGCVVTAHASGRSTSEISRRQHAACRCFQISTKISPERRTTATGSNATALYYFFYDWEVQPLSLVCSSERVPVNVDLLTTGVEESSSTLGVNVFPNPADRDLFIDVTGQLAQGVLLVRIMDSTGRVVAVERVDNGRATVTTADLDEGLYTYHLVREGMEVGRGTFVVAHLW